MSRSYDQLEYNKLNLKKVIRNFMVIVSVTTAPQGKDD